MGLLWRGLGKLFGSNLLAFLLLAALFYLLARKVVVSLVFPGSLCIYRRKIESDFQSNIGSSYLSCVRDFRACLDIFRCEENAQLDIYSIGMDRSDALAACSAAFRKISE